MTTIQAGLTRLQASYAAEQEASAKFCVEFEKAIGGLNTFVYELERVAGSEALRMVARQGRLLEALASQRPIWWLVSTDEQVKPSPLAECLYLLPESLHFLSDYVDLTLWTAPFEESFCASAECVYDLSKYSPTPGSTKRIACLAVTSDSIPHCDDDEKDPHPAVQGPTSRLVLLGVSGAL
jgi:hypothetical protein